MRVLSIISFLLSVLLFLGSSVTYHYTYYQEAVHSAPGMTFASYANSQTIGVPLVSPEDMVVYNDLVYIVDSGTNSLLVLTKDLSLVASYETFEISNDLQNKLQNNEQDVPVNYNLKKPYGIDVTENGIFICDTGNNRIIKLNHDFEVTDIFSNMDDPTFETISFEPKKITVDPNDRMYVVAKNVYEGIMEINSDGSFNRFTGVNPISLTPFEIFSRSLMTEKQLAQLQLYLPTEYTNVNIDQDNFIYATSKPSENSDENTIQLINPKGVDVIRRNGYYPPMGDIQYIDGNNNYVITGPSLLVDIDYTKSGIYTVLDQKRSRLFTYDKEGNLLYINGDEGNQSDKFSDGTAIAYLGDDLLVLDRGTKTIIVYRLTEFGQLVNQAIAYHNDGEYEKAAEVWEKVVKLNTNYEIAYNGIGKLYLRQGYYKEAMQYFKLGHDAYYYSKAYQEYRNELLKDNFNIIMIITLIIGSTGLGLRIRSIYRKGGSVLYED